MNAPRPRTATRWSFLLRLVDVFAASTAGGAVGAALVLVGFSLAHRTAGDTVLMAAVVVGTVIGGNWPYFITPSLRAQGRTFRLRTRLVLLVVALVLTLWVDATRTANAAPAHAASGEVIR